MHTSPSIVTASSSLQLSKRSGESSSDSPSSNSSNANSHNGNRTRPIHAFTNSHNRASSADHMKV
jgi:hypothetical protein